MEQFNHLLKEDGPLPGCRKAVLIAFAFVTVKLLFFNGNILREQNAMAVSGVVTDDSGSALPGALLYPGGGPSFLRMTNIDLDGLIYRSNEVF